MKNFLLAVTVMFLTVCSFAVTPTNCGGQAACANFTVSAQGGVLFTHYDLAHDGNGNLTSVNNAAISTSGAPGGTSTATIGSGTFRGHQACNNPSFVCAPGTVLGTVQVGTGLPTDSPYNTLNNTVYNSSVFDTTTSDFAMSGFLGRECRGDISVLTPHDMACGSYLLVATNGSCARFTLDPNPDANVLYHPKNCGINGAGLVSRDWCPADGSVQSGSSCAFIGRFSGTISFQTQNDGSNLLSGTVVGMVPNEAYDGVHGTLLRTTCDFRLRTVSNFVPFSPNGNIAIDTVTVDNCR